MRSIALISITLAMLSISTVGARADGTWCANYKNGLTNCGFYSFQQCEAARWGNGGFCYRNPFAANGATREPQRRYRRNY